MRRRHERISRRATPRGVPIARALVLVALLGACADEAPTAPRRASDAIARAYFGRDSVIWFRNDSAGAWTMRPLLDSSRVYFERDALVDPDAGYAVVEPARLVALERETGTPLWHGDIVSAHNAAVAGSRVAVVWGGLQTFDRRSGTPGPIFVPDGTTVHSNVESDAERFYVGTHDGRIMAVNGDALEPAWTAAIGARAPVFGITLAGDAVVATAKWFSPDAQRDSGIVMAADRATGAVRWRYGLPTDSLPFPGIVRPAVASGDLVIVATQGHEVRALDVATGAVRWRYDARSRGEEWASDGLAACDGNVVVATGDLGLASLRATDGRVAWRMGYLGSGSLSWVDCTHGTVLARGSLLTIHDAASGVVLRRYPQAEFSPDERPLFVASVTRDAGTLYLGTAHGFAAVGAP